MFEGTARIAQSGTEHIMEFGLSDEQKMLAESLTGFLKTRAPLESIRKIADTGTGHDDGLWQGIVEQGIAGLMIDEAHGGLGLGLLDAAVAAEALGYGAAPVPFAASLVMAPVALRLSGTAAHQDEWLPRIATGEVRAGVAFAGWGGQTGKAKVTLEGDRLSGAVDGALDAGAATHLIVVLPDGRMTLAGARDAGVSMTMRKSLDPTRPVTTLTFDKARVVLLDAANDPRAAALRTLDAGRVILAADTLGAGQSMIDKAVAYAKERVQFGRVIGSFQGVKHTLADVVTAFEPCRSLVWYAAHAQDAVPDEARITALQAKAHLGDVGRDVARLTTEVHGGMGFTDLLGLHFYFKRIAFDRQMLGAPERCRDEAAVVQGWAKVTQ
jgi:alkylation response protein AidB-like acyl-CoA dehydrogenase